MVAQDSIDRERLGETVEEFAPTGCTRRVVGAFASLVALMGAYTVVSELFIQEEMETAGVVMGVVLAALGALGMRFGFRTPPTFVLCQDGLALVKRTETIQARWDEMQIHQNLSQWLIDEEHRSQHRRVRVRAWAIRNARGELMVVTQPWELHHRIAEKVIPLMWPTVRDRIERGERVELGNLIVDRDGLQQGDTRVGWSEIEAARFTRYLQVKTAEKTYDWTMVMQFDLLNYELIRMAMREYSQSQD